MNPKCPIDAEVLLTWSEYHEREHHEGIESIEGILGFNKYCFKTKDTQKTHPFFCDQHQIIHQMRCDHDYSVVDDAFEAPCPKCGDILTNAANFRE